jgi:hypothetical protein
MSKQDLDRKASNKMTPKHGVGVSSHDQRPDALLECLIQKGLVLAGIGLETEGVRGLRRGTHRGTNQGVGWTIHPFVPADSTAVVHVVFRPAY